MSDDGRDESAGDGDATAGATPQVPSGQGRPGVPSGGVPAQRDWHEDSVLPPPRELPPSDAELISRMRSGEDTAYEELYRRHAEAVRRYARNCCRDTYTADDLTAEVFARMLQAVRGGSGPEHTVRAYLLTSVRRVAAAWTQSARREQLVDDFAVFATQAARLSDASDDAVPGLDLGADVRAMHEAERSLAMRAFRSLPERWQAVLWHTEVEDESPSEVATLFGLDANGTRVLASRAREGLKQAYLQAHVSSALAGDEGCARYADQLGTYARGRLRTRAERGLRKHLAECARCRLAASQIEEVAGGIPAVVPVAVLGWFGAAGYAKVAGLLTGAGAAGAAGAGAAAGGGSSGGAASDGMGAPAKAGIAAGVAAVAAAAALAFALAGNDKPDTEPKAEPRTSSPVVQPGEDTPPPTAEHPEPKPPGIVPAYVPSTRSTPTHGLTPTPSPSSASSPTSTTTPTPAPTHAPTDTAPTPDPPAAPAVYRWSELAYNVHGDGSEPEMRFGESGWVWQRSGMSIAGTRYAHGVSVHTRSSVTIDLNRPCSSYDAMVGVDDVTLGLGRVRFSVHADGVRLWSSGLIKGGDPAVPVHVDLAGRRTVRLIVEPHGLVDAVGLADWAVSRFTCG